jgi:hypothetical protein
LKYGVALGPTNFDTACLFSLLNQINWTDRKSVEMDMLDQLLLVAHQFAFQCV